MQKSTDSSAPLEELKNHNHKQGPFERFSSFITHTVGSTGAFLSALIIVIAWAVTGPLFGFSETWQLIINTGTTIITFLMVFLIQKSQNKDSKAIQMKLNELIACNRYASNRLISLEDLTEEELDIIHRFYHELSKRAERASSIHETHSLDEAGDWHAGKKRWKKESTSRAERR